MDKEERRILAELSHNMAHTAHLNCLYAQAEHWYKNCLILIPANKSINHSLAFQLALQRKFDEAIKHFTISMTHDDKGKAAHAEYTRGLIYLNMNKYPEGFRDIDARLELAEQKHINDRFAGRKYWNGEACNSVYIYGEQGFGDVIMFSRYLPLIKKRFKVDKIYFEVPDSCMELFKYNFRNSPEIIMLEHPLKVADLGTNKEVLGSDYFIHCMSLPRIFGTTFETVPEIKMEAPPEYIKKFSYLKKRRSVAVCYGGRPNGGDWQATEWNARRNIEKDTLDKALHGFYIAPIQKEYNSEIHTWCDTAGILANVEFVVSVDSGPIHLAGAMHVPTVLLNHFQSCWRWTLDQEHTPWYNNSLTIIRQEKEGDWTSVFEKLKDHLKKHYG